MIAIPNMEKPKNCQECPAHTFNYGYIPDYDGCRILKRAFNIDKLDINPFDEVLPDCPLIDIVRCGECKWCDDKGKGRALICTNPYIDMDIHPLDFCSYGERANNTRTE